MTTIRYFAFDTETTGLEPFLDGDEIISFAYMLLDKDLACLAKGQWFVFPTKDVSAEAAAINGYRADMWAERNALTQAEFVRELIVLWETHGVERAYPLGQNVGFDVDFLKARAQKYPLLRGALSKALAYHKIDTLPLAVAFDQAHPPESFASYRLTDQAERWGVSAVNAHDSLADLEMTVELYRKYVEHLRQGPRPPAPKPTRFLEKFGSTMRFRFGKHKGLLLENVDKGYLRWALTRELWEDERIIFTQELTRR